MARHLTIAAVLALALAGCNTPSPAFRGIAPTRVTAGQSTFDVRRQGFAVELIRVSPEPVRTLRQVAPRAAQAVRLATGCEMVVESLRGEATLMFADIVCPDGA